ncbi:MAG: ABC transporter permease [Thermotogae bacterium]|nr:ABC transporter permease [Thermotogota bacterium]
MRRFFKNPLNLISLAIFTLILTMGFFPDLFTSYDPYEMNIEEMLAPPSLKHIFGTDQFGRDLFARVVYGLKKSILVAFFSMVIACAIGSTVGITSAYFGGKYDIFVMRIIDAFFSFPPLILALFIVAFFGTGMLKLIMSISIVYTPIFARTVRSFTLPLRDVNYVLAAKSIGRRDASIILFHILPNILPMIMVTFTMNFSTAFLTEATLGFLGFGVPPPEPSLGGLIGEGRNYFLGAPWVMIYPGLVVAMMVFSVNMITDSLQELMNPRK